MVRRSLGEAIDEADLIEEWGEPLNRSGYPLEYAGNVVVRLPLPSDAFLFDEITEALEDGWLVAPVCGGPMTVFAQRHDLRSPLGILCDRYQDHDALLGCGPPLHVVVLIAADRQHVTFLDPWFGAENQPLQMTRVWFVRHAWAAALRRPR